MEQEDKTMSFLPKMPLNDITLSIDILKLLQECMQIQIYILDSFCTFCTLDSLILSKKIPSLMGFAYPHKVRVSLLL